MSKYYMFTCNNWNEDSIKNIDRVYKSAGVEYITYQKEIAPKTLTPHLQGYICFIKKKMKSTVINLLIGCSIQSRRGKHSQAKKYCQKKESRVPDTTFIELGNDIDIPEGQGFRKDLEDIQLELKTKSYDVVEEANFSSFCRYHKYFKQYADKQKDKAYNKVLTAKFDKAALKEWQKEVLHKLLDQTDRQVLWVWESIGNVGKTFLGQWLEAIKGAYVCQLGKKADLAYAYNYERIVVFDLTRSDKEFINYSTIESFKNGRIFSSKYESKMKKFNPCKVVIFSNFEPDYEKLSRDRYDVYRINEPKYRIETDFEGITQIQ